MPVTRGDFRILYFPSRPLSDKTSRSQAIGGATSGEPHELLRNHRRHSFNSASRRFDRFISPPSLSTAVHEVIQTLSLFVLLFYAPSRGARIKLFSCVDFFFLTLVRSDYIHHRVFFFRAGIYGGQECAYMQCIMVVHNDALWPSKQNYIISRGKLL